MYNIKCMKRIAALLLIFPLISCSSEEGPITEHEFQPEKDTVEFIEPLFWNDSIKVGAERFDQYIDELSGKKVAIVGNQTSMTGSTHLVDTLIAQGVNLVQVFSPEHGFRGTEDAGAHVENGKDPITGLPVISLYGNNKKPKASQLEGIDVVLFDLQDVGARFYTYISTMFYVMEACAENNIECIVLDRPNPNGHFVDGPMLKEGFSSFVGLLPIPVIHGMTVGELAQMINGENWLNDGQQCDLKVVTCSGYNHNRFYELPVAPSPNLKNMTSIYLYPGLCFFEGTVVSIGRGTDLPFQVVGHPDFEVEVLEDLYSFTPSSKPGASNPKLKGETCYGYDLHEQDIKEIRAQKKLDLSYLIEFYQQLNKGKDFFLSNNFIDLLAGTDQLRLMILEGKTEEEIRESWKAELKAFKEKRKLYLLYKDFED